jgi:hypothetical protein
MLSCFGCVIILICLFFYIFFWEGGCFGIRGYCVQPIGSTSQAVFRHKYEQFPQETNNQSQSSTNNTTTP